MEHLTLSTDDARAPLKLFGWALLIVVLGLSFGVGLYLSLQAFPNRQLTTTTTRTENVTEESSVSINDTTVQVKVLELRLVARAQPAFMLTLANTDSNLTLRSVSVMLIPGAQANFESFVANVRPGATATFSGSFEPGSVTAGRQYVIELVLRWTGGCTPGTCLHNANYYRLDIPTVAKAP